MKISLVQIIYRDITSSMEGLKDLGECYRWFKEENDLITTVGWLLEKDKQGVLIAATWDKKENEFNENYYFSEKNNWEKRFDERWQEEMEKIRKRYPVNFSYMYEAMKGVVKDLLGGQRKETLKDLEKIVIKFEDQLPVEFLARFFEKTDKIRKL